MLILDDDIPFTDRLFLMCAGLAVTRGTPVRFVFSSIGQTPYRITRPAIQVLEGMTQFRKLRVEGAELGSSIVEIWPDDFQPEGTINVQLPLAASVSLAVEAYFCLLYTSPSPRDKRQSRMPSSA